MNSTFRIPTATEEKLANPAGPGKRHAQIIEIASSLIGNGCDPNEAFSIIRPKYGADLPDSEIANVIEWAIGRIPPKSPSGSHKWFSIRKRPKSGFQPVSNASGNEAPPLKPETAVKRFLNGFEYDEADLWEASDVRLDEPFENDPILIVSTLFRPGERINIVTDSRISGDKANPRGYGEIDTRENWIKRFSDNRLNAGKAGAWIRPNPLDGSGITDRNVTAFRFLLVKTDEIPLSLQIPFLSKIPLPISAIITSGGKSLHAWVRIDAKDETKFRETAKTIFGALSRYGIDTANRNPSRLSRLPGVLRNIGNGEDNRQRLLYLAHFPTSQTIST